MGKIVFRIYFTFGFWLMVSQTSFGEEKSSLLEDDLAKGQESQKLTLNGKDIHAFPVKEADLVLKKSWSGKIDAKEQVDVRAKGYITITEILVQNGQTVQKGDVLLKIDRDAAEQKIKDLRAELKIKQLDLKNELLAFEQKEKNYQVQKSLWSKQVIAQKKYDEAYNEYAMAKNKLDTSEINFKKYEDGIKEQIAKLDTSNYVAPISGVVTGLIELEGKDKNVYQNTKLLSVSNLSELVFRILVEDNNVHRLSVGGSATIKLDNFPDQKFQGKITQVGSQPAEDNSMSFQKKYEVMISLPQDPKLKQQLAGQVEVVFAESKQALTVPLATLNSIAGEYFVFAAKEKNASPEQRKIEIGIQTDHEAEVLSGLQKGDWVFKNYEEN